ncbi:MAG: response regulator [Candidatus Eisenbacteria bacterium]|nr:response regulator [Candidatus Eisenbacteria bacterium]
MSVLIVDDQSEILTLLTERLSLDGIACTTARSAPEALALHRDEHFAVILTDIKMPGMSGVQLLRKVKQIHPTTIVFVMTGFPTLTGLVECLEAGAADYFLKPFPSLDLVSASIENAIERHERWRVELAAFRAMA